MRKGRAVSGRKAQVNLRVLVHPFFFLNNKQRGYSAKEADVLFGVWRKEMGKAAERGHYFAFVSDNLGKGDFKRIESHVAKNRAGSLRGREEKLLAYALRRIGKEKLIFVPAEGIISFLKAGHLREKGIVPSKTRAVLFGERIGGCVKHQRYLLHEAGIPRQNISILAHRSVEPEPNGISPWTWDAMLAELKQKGKKSALGGEHAELAEKLAELARNSGKWKKRGY